MIYLTRLKRQTIVSITHYLLNDHSMMHSESITQLHIQISFKISFIVSSLLDF